MSGKERKIEEIVQEKQRSEQNNSLTDKESAVFLPTQETPLGQISAAEMLPVMKAQLSDSESFESPPAILKATDINLLQALNSNVKNQKSVSKESSIQDVDGPIQSFRIQNPQNLNTSQKDEQQNQKNSAEIKEHHQKVFKEQDKIDAEFSEQRIHLIRQTEQSKGGLMYSEIATQADFSGHTKRASGLSDENLNLLDNAAFMSTQHHQLMHFAAAQGTHTPNRNIKVIPYTQKNSLKMSSNQAKLFGQADNEMYTQVGYNTSSQSTKNLKQMQPAQINLTMQFKREMNQNKNRKKNGFAKKKKSSFVSPNSNSQSVENFGALLGNTRGSQELNAFPKQYRLSVTSMNQRMIQVKRLGAAEHNPTSVAPANANNQQGSAEKSQILKAPQARSLSALQRKQQNLISNLHQVRNVPKKKEFIIKTPINFERQEFSQQPDFGQTQKGIIGVDGILAENSDPRQVSLNTDSHTKGIINVGHLKSSEESLQLHDRNANNTTILSPNQKEGFTGSANHSKQLSSGQKSTIFDKHKPSLYKSKIQGNFEQIQQQSHQQNTSHSPEPPSPHIQAKLINLQKTMTLNEEQDEINRNEFSPQMQQIFEQNLKTQQDRLLNQNKAKGPNSKSSRRSRSGSQRAVNGRSRDDQSQQNSTRKHQNNQMLAATSSGSHKRRVEEVLAPRNADEFNRSLVSSWKRTGAYIPTDHNNQKNDDQLADHKKSSSLIDVKPLESKPDFGSEEKNQLQGNTPITPPNLHQQNHVNFAQNDSNQVTNFGDQIFNSVKNGVSPSLRRTTTKKSPNQWQLDRGRTTLVRTQTRFDDTNNSLKNDESLSVESSKKLVTSLVSQEGGRLIPENDEQWQEQQKTKTRQIIQSLRKLQQDNIIKDKDKERPASSGDVVTNDNQGQRNSLNKKVGSTKQLARNGSSSQRSVVTRKSGSLKKQPDSLSNTFPMPIDLFTKVENRTFSRRHSSKRKFEEGGEQRGILAENADFAVLDQNSDTKSSNVNLNAQGILHGSSKFVMQRANSAKKYQQSPNYYVGRNSQKQINSRQIMSASPQKKITPSAIVADGVISGEPQNRHFNSPSQGTENLEASRRKSHQKSTGGINKFLQKSIDGLTTYQGGKPPLPSQGTSKIYKINLSPLQSEAEDIAVKQQSETTAAQAPPMSIQIEKRSIQAKTGKNDNNDNSRESANIQTKLHQNSCVKQQNFSLLMKGGNADVALHQLSKHVQGKVVVSVGEAGKSIQNEKGKLYSQMKDSEQQISQIMSSSYNMQAQHVTKNMLMQNCVKRFTRIKHEIQRQEKIEQNRMQRNLKGKVAQRQRLSCGFNPQVYAQRQRKTKILRQQHEQAKKNELRDQKQAGQENGVQQQISNFESQQKEKFITNGPEIQNQQKHQPMQILNSVLLQQIKDGDSQYDYQMTEHGSPLVSKNHSYANQRICKGDKQESERKEVDSQNQQMQVFKLIDFQKRKQGQKKKQTDLQQKREPIVLPQASITSILPPPSTDSEDKKNHLIVTKAAGRRFKHPLYQVNSRNQQKVGITSSKEMSRNNIKRPNSSSSAMKSFDQEDTATVVESAEVHAKQQLTEMYQKRKKIQLKTSFNTCAHNSVQRSRENSLKVDQGQDGKVTAGGIKQSYLEHIGSRNTTAASAKQFAITPNSAVVSPAYAQKKQINFAGQGFQKGISSIEEMPRRPATAGRNLMRLIGKKPLANVNSSEAKLGLSRKNSKNLLSPSNNKSAQIESASRNNSVGKLQKSFQALSRNIRLQNSKSGSNQTTVVERYSSNQSQKNFSWAFQQQNEELNQRKKRNQFRFALISKTRNTKQAQSQKANQNFSNLQQNGQVMQISQFDRQFVQQKQFYNEDINGEFQSSEADAAAEMQKFREEVQLISNHLQPSGSSEMLMKSNYKQIDPKMLNQSQADAPQMMGISENPPQFSKVVHILPETTKPSLSVTNRTNSVKRPPTKQQTSLQNIASFKIPQITVKQIKKSKDQQHYDGGGVPQNSSHS